MTKFKKNKKVTKIQQGLYEKHVQIFRLWRKHVQSSTEKENICKVSKQLVQNCKRSCAHKR